jgi:hypothetical protein
MAVLTTTSMSMQIRDDVVPALEALDSVALTTGRSSALPQEKPSPPASTLIAHSISCRPQLCYQVEDAQNLRSIPHHLTIAHLPPA